jgi:CO/xanthine dehydrogenase Mo-binding subunit
MSGNAVLRAAREVRAALVAQAATMLGVGAEAIELADGRAWARGAPERALDLGAVVKAASGAGRAVQALAEYQAPAAPTIDPLTGQGKPFNDYTFGAQAAEVEIDAETGVSRVSRLVSCYDVGQAINRQSAEGQLEGGAVMGLGYALTEEVVVEDGLVKNPHLLDYKIPTTLDAPVVETIMLESGQGLGPFGAKGLGEPSMTPTIAVVANAVSRALGTRVTTLPLTAERVLGHLRAARGRI